MGAVKRTHPSAVKRQKNYKSLRKLPRVTREAAEAWINFMQGVFAEAELDDLILNGTSPKEPVGITAEHVDRSILPECVWEGLEAHDERD